MKSILLSIKPKWVAKILNGEKTIEVRKRFPENYKGWVYIYCTKEDSLIKLQEKYKDRYICEQEFKCDDFPKMYSDYEGKGKVVARFYCDKVEKIEIYWRDKYSYADEPYFKTNTLTEDELLERSCLYTFNDLCDYIGISGYAIHISQLEIFDRPKELSEFKQEWYDCGSNFHSKPLTKAPQSYMFIEVDE